MQVILFYFEISRFSYFNGNDFFFSSPPFSFSTFAILLCHACTQADKLFRPVNEFHIHKDTYMNIGKISGEKTSYLRR